jgi:hypothetical protein
VLQMSPHDAALLREALDQAQPAGTEPPRPPRPAEGGDR